MCRPPENVSDYPEISFLKRRFYYYCVVFTAEPTVSNAITEKLSLNKESQKKLSRCIIRTS